MQESLEKLKQWDRKIENNIYTQKWLYQCILLRIKNSAMYDYIRRNEILALPSRSTISRYLRNLKAHYGFDKNMFDLMKNKSGTMSPKERRGVILLDEMKISPYASLDNQTLEVNGFTNLGKYTPEHQVDSLGDHGLVLIFQPFMGSWTQPLAAFLSKNAAPGHVLAQIVLEAIILLENSGFFVDAIISDGAQWNRAMWRQFGCSLECPSCVHPCDEDEDRKLQFLSDPPHLIKNYRNWVLKEKCFQTPDGQVNVKFWRNLLNILEKSSKYSIKVCKLTKNHLDPEHYEKMNVGLAYQFFGFDVAKAMELYKDERTELQGCEATIAFIIRTHKLILAMNSRTPKGALWPNSEELKVIQEFLNYVQEWHNMGQKTFLTENTFVGFVATLKGTLELYEFLTGTCGFQYLMTNRLNQNNLEKFFGIIRSHCGTHDHPNSLLFIQIYRLLNVYSLVKPPKKTNVGGVSQEMIQNFLNRKKILESDQESEEKKYKMNLLLDELVDTGVEFEEIVHNADLPPGLHYFCGYVARKAKSFTSCQNCIKLMTKDREPNERNLISLRDQFGLTYPSECLQHFVSVIENFIVAECDDKITHDTPANILEQLYDENVDLPLLGCNDADHQKYLTRKILRFLLTVRMYFVLKVLNKEEEKKQKTKKKRKESKL